MSPSHALPSTPVPGAMFGRYKILRKLGEGGMGVVYEAEHSDLGKRVALKTLRPHLMSDNETVGRFVREGQAAARIRHPHVVDVTDVGTARGVPYLVMEFLEGETLAARIQRGPMPPDEVAMQMLPVCAAVASAHAQGVLHRDLKPANILLERTARGAVRPKVLDFGIAKICDADASHALTDSAAVLGTPHYMSPEQARGSRDVDARSDQYALGVILYECSTGRRPFEGASLLALAWEITSGELRPPRAVAPALPEDFGALVLRAMARDPSQRFASVRELGAALLPFADERTQLLWEDAFDPSSDPAPTPERRPSTPAPRAALVLAETVDAPAASAPPRPPRPWWALAVVGAALLGVTAHRFTRAPTPTSTTAPVAALVGAVHAPAPQPVAPAVVLADVTAVTVRADAPTPAAVVARTPPARPVGSPLRGGPGRRPPTSSAPGQREIPME